jgi:hypothetical protein
MTIRTRRLPVCMASTRLKSGRTAVHVRRTAVHVALLCTISVSAAAFEVFDPINWIQHRLQNQWRETIGVVIENQLDKIRQMAQRLSAFTNLVKYVAPDAPLWRTRRIDDALHDIKRQQDPALKAVVERLSGGEVRAAVSRLEAQGRVHAIAEPDDRLRAVAAVFATSPSATLVVSPDNHSRGQLNTRIRAALQETGQVGREDRPITVLMPRQDLTGVDRRWAAHYETGDVVRYTRGSPEHALEAGAYARVTAVDGVNNTLTVARGDGRSVTYDPRRLQGVTVYRDVERTFAVGDRVQFTAPFRPAKIANRELGTITALTDRQEMRVRTDAGKTITFSVDATGHGPRAHRHLDHGYAVTSYSSQGLTADRVLLYIDSEQAGERLVNQRLAYVALSRGRHDAQIPLSSTGLLRYKQPFKTLSSTLFTGRISSPISRSRCGTFETRFKYR